MKKLILISLISLFVFYNYDSKAQGRIEVGYEYASDALRFSTYQPVGSTRIQSIGGAQTALGGDISNAIGNPAGLGFFNKSEFTITPTISIIPSVSKFLGTTTNSAYGNLNFNNLGIVFSRAKSPISPGKWRGGSLAVTYNTTNNYNNRFQYSGRNDNNSISNYYAERANDRTINYNDLGDEVNPNNEYLSWEALAFGTYLIDVVDPDTAADSYYTFIDPESVRQKESITTKGSSSQWNFSYGGNYNDKLYFGASLGLASFRYTETSHYSESVLTQNDQYDDIRDFQINHIFSSKGQGINFNLGIIYRANDYIRFGGSVQTPTYFYSIQAQDDGDIVVNFNNYQYNPSTVLTRESGRLETTINKYKFSTPWKFSGGVAFFFNKQGFISADVDYIAYDKIKLYPGDAYLAFHEVNQTIKSAYKPNLNFRIGGEYRASIYRLRAGYSMYGTALEREDNSSNNPKATHYASIGAGLRKESFYLDLGLVYTFARKFSYYPYYLNDFPEPVANVTNSRVKSMVTLGFFF